MRKLAWRLHCRPGIVEVNAHRELSLVGVDNEKIANRRHGCSRV